MTDSEKSLFIQYFHTALQSLAWRYQSELTITYNVSGACHIKIGDLSFDAGSNPAFVAYSQAYSRLTWEAAQAAAAGKLPKPRDW